MIFDHHDATLEMYEAKFGRRDLPAFGDRLEFRVKLIPYDGDDAWVEPTVVKIRETLAAPQAPAPTEGCAYCAFAQKASRA